jgi:hypothetical protein
VDIDSIAYGDNFVKAVEHSLGLSAVAIIVIGPQWLSVTDKKGGRRLDDPKDFVRQEVALALGSGIKVIPALVEGASMPGEDVLPPPLAELALHNAIELSDSRWEFDVGRLLEALEAALAKGRHSPATEDA